MLPNWGPKLAIGRMQQDAASQCSLGRQQEEGAACFRPLPATTPSPALQRRYDLGYGLHPEGHVASDNICHRPKWLNIKTS